MNSIDSKLAELRGLEGAKAVVSRLGARTEGAHAVLFYGAVGAGKRSLGRILAQAWLCLDEANPACGECRPCQAFQRESAADFLLIQPGGASSLIRKHNVVPSKEPTGKEDPGIPISHFLRSSPIQGRRKVVMVVSVDRMNQDAANSLLKMLEEPPPFARFVLTTSEIGKVLPTVRSRCLTVACELPIDASAGSDPLWRLAGSAPGRWEKIREREDVYSAIYELAQRAGHAPPHEALNLAEQLRDLGESLKPKGDASEEGGMRAFHAEAVSTFARALEIAYPERPAWTQAAAEAHRRVLGNANAAYAYDMLFTELTTR